MAVDELIDVLGRAQIEAVLRLSIDIGRRSPAFPVTPPYVRVLPRRPRSPDPALRDLLSRFCPSARIPHSGTPRFLQTPPRCDPPRRSSLTLHHAGRGWVEDFHLQAVEHARHTGWRIHGALRHVCESTACITNRCICPGVPWMRHPPLNELVGLGRVELPTSPLSGVRSSHLSYRPT